MRVHECGVRAVLLNGWSMELLAFCKSPVVHLIVETVCSLSFFLVGEPSGRNRPLREAPCIYV